MPLPKSIDRFIHLLPAWESALAVGGSILEVNSHNEAQRLRHELYHLRRLLVDKHKDMRFSHLQIELKKGAMRLTIRPAGATFRITNAEGSGPEFASMPQQKDEFELQAERLALQLENENDFKLEIENGETND